MSFPSYASRDRSVPVPQLGPGRVWLAEGAATLLMLLAMTVLFRDLLHPQGWLAGRLASDTARLLADAAVSGAVVGALIASPLGRVSGAHMNPAVSVMLCMAGRLPAVRLPLYVSAQLTGSLLGTALGRVVVGDSVAHPKVRYALLRPLLAEPPLAIGIGETVGTAVLLAIVWRLVSDPALEEVAAVTVGATLTVLIILTARVTGGSLNPARQFGPWLMAGVPGPAWPYLVGPMGAAVAVGALARLLPVGGGRPWSQR
ncbi:aquaporin [Streptomyces sp. NPDC094149]|uniref:aquaporin n=1 Tax=Streptomyces sp. NPDC094149 TaxID=3155079 RepID=UPI00333381FD